jgi:hypothetical protein
MMYVHIGRYTYECLIAPQLMLEAPTACPQWLPLLLLLL